MTTICIDINVLTRMVKSESWWVGVRRDVINSNRLIIVGARGKYKREVDHVRAVKVWLLELSRAGKLKMYDRGDVERIQERIEHDIPESRCNECDDLHIFGIMNISGCRYLFSEDKRLCICKSKIGKNARGKKYTRFRVIRTENIYKAHRKWIV